MIPDSGTDSTPVAETDTPTGTTSHYLSPEHVKELAASGIASEVARLNGIYTEADAAEVGRLLNWRGPAKKLGDCLVFVYHDAHGNRLPYARVKPSTPRMGSKGHDKGKPIKYESPYYSKNRAYLPSNTRPVLADPNKKLLITEGEKKALCADAHGFPCVGLSGVWAWQRPRVEGEDGEKVGPRELIDDLAAVAWDGREVFIAFDSDAVTNGLVRAAERELGKVLTANGAVVKVVRLPHGGAA